MRANKVRQYGPLFSLPRDGGYVRGGLRLALRGLA